MTFDELWRLDLPQKDALRHSIQPADTGFFDGPASNDCVLADLDETEMDWFLEWLETACGQSTPASDRFR